MDKMTREDIQRYLPHREPMLLVDEVFQEADGTVHGFYRIREDEFFCRGHFPGNPMVPGVILCEIMAQTCFRLMTDDLPGHIPVFRCIDGVKFRNAVHPGDLCEVICRVDEKMAGIYVCSARLEVGGKRCCQGKLTIAVVADPTRAATA